MPHQPGEPLHIFQFENLQARTVRHAIFGRHGGISPDPWRSLNVGGTVGDDPARVRENVVRCFRALDLAPKDRFDAWQVHGARVLVVDGPRGDQPPPKADALLTNRPGVVLFMRFADCVPILLHDPVRGVVGVVHAGWRGTVAGVARRAVEVMVEEFGSNPADVRAALGPSVGPDHYPVGEEVVEQVEQAFGPAAKTLLTRVNGQVHLDLWAANERALRRAGVRSVEVAAVCTACHVEDWYSHRGEQGKTGRFGALIARVA